MKPLAAVIAPPSGIVEALKDFEQWCLSAREKLGAIDGYDYRSGEEYGLRRAELEAHRRICALLSQPKTGGAHPAPSVVEALREARHLISEYARYRYGEPAFEATIAKIDAALSGKGAAPSVGDELVAGLVGALKDAYHEAEKEEAEHIAAKSRSADFFSGRRNGISSMLSLVLNHFCNLADQEAFANAIRSALSRTPASGEGR
jgi:hypothetical protein